VLLIAAHDTTSVCSCHFYLNAKKGTKEFKLGNSYVDLEREEKIMKCKKIVIATFMVIALSLSSLTVSAQDPTDDDANVAIKKGASRVEMIVHRPGARTRDGYCETIRWTASTYLDEGGPSYGHHNSISRDADYPYIPCDIPKICTRGRIWADNELQEDTSMKCAYNSADKAMLSCSQKGSSSYHTTRGDHNFDDAWTPWTWDEG